MSPFEQRLPSLWHNGAQDPDAWRPEIGSLKHGAGRASAEEGDLVGWRYGAWRVTDLKIRDGADLSKDDIARLDELTTGMKPELKAGIRARNLPRQYVLRHESGPLILKPGEKSLKLHDGGRVIHVGTRPGRHAIWSVLKEPYRACSCHGHIWPCQEIDLNALTLHESMKADRLFATAQPGVCAHCLEPISQLQRTVTFPEESRLVPGAPGPTFHAGRAACWAAAEDYERSGRLKDNPFVTRLASCPGIRFIHEQLGMPADKRLECTAGTECTGLHGPAGYRQDAPCWFRVQILANEGGYPRPGTDCGYRGGNGACLGGDLSSGGTSIGPTAADVQWENRQESHRRGGGLL